MKTNNDKQQQIGRQIDALTRAFGALSVDRAKFWRVVRRAECKARRAAEMYLSRPEYGRERMERETVEAVQRVFECFASPVKLGFKLYVNTDPRGYALKLQDVGGLGIFTDMGGDGILAPEF